MYMNRFICLAILASALTLSAESPHFSVVNNPEIPLKMTFAGQSVDLDRTDRFERLDRELTSMAYTHGNTLLQIKRANRYFPVMAPILKKNGVPEDLLYLACIESTLDPRAVSPANAAGLWQFMPSTGRDFGLEVTADVDERFDPEKSTEAACKYLKKAFDKYGSWESVAASYNAGMGRISREQTGQGASSAYDLWLPNETMRYIYRLLAAKVIMENPAHYGFSLTADQLYQPLEFRKIEVSTAVDSWAEWAKARKINYMILREYNPWIRSDKLPNPDGKTYIVKIPTDDSMSRSHQHRHVYNHRWIKK